MSNGFKIGDKVRVANVKKTSPYLNKVGTIIEPAWNSYLVSFKDEYSQISLYFLGEQLELVKDETFPEKWYIKGGEELAKIIIDLEEMGYKCSVYGDKADWYIKGGGFNSEKRYLDLDGSESPLDKGTEITPEQFKQYVLSQNKEEKEMNKTQKISREGLGELYNNVCADWQSKIMSIISTDKFANEFEVDENLIKQAYKEANETQIYLLDKYFTKPKKKVTKNLERWVNVFADGHISGHHLTKENAIADIDRYQVKRNIIATVKLVGTYETEE